MPVYPLLATGDLATADLLTSMIYDYTLKTTNQSIISSTTYQTDTELVTPTLAVGTWEIWLDLLTASQTAVKVRWATTGTMSGNRRCLGPGSTETTAEDVSSSRWNASGFSTDVVYGFRTAGSQYWLAEHAVLTVTSAGTVTAEWGQNVSNANNTTVAAGSFFRTKRLA